jgi:glyoxylate/hydroxypyruvate reductase A
MSILCRLHTAYGDALIDGIRAALPDERIFEWPETGDPDDVEICIVFRMEPGFLRPFRNLKLISATGAGVDHYLLDPDLPRDVPLVRVVDADFGARMADYVLTWVLFHHREVGHFLRAQRDHRWDYKPIRSAGEIVVGIMGLGQMGAVTAPRLASLGYTVRGWARTPHTLPGVRCFTGDALEPFLDGTEILVNLLPLTPNTACILRAHTFNRMRRGGVVIHAARGGHLVEADLIDALDTGQLRAATIDAFPTEPLAPGHPFWDRDDVYVTPHCSSTASLETIVTGFADNVRRFRAGETLAHQVDFEQGY